jgi:hypothetical protein
MPKKPLTPGLLLARAADADAKLDKLYAKVKHQMRRKERLKRLLGKLMTLELNLNLPEDTNASA